MVKAISQELAEELLQKLRLSGRDVISFLNKLQQMTGNQKDYEKSLKQGINALIMHRKSGGKIKTAAVSPKESELVKRELKKSGVAFVSVLSQNPDKEIIMSRDVDYYLVESCIKNIRRILSQGLSELMLSDLMKIYGQYGNDFLMTKGLDKADLEVFRREISDVCEYRKAEEKTYYSVVADPDDENKFAIVYPDSNIETFENALNGTAFMFSGHDGQKIKSLMNDAVEEKERFINIVINNAATGKNVFIVDSINPNKYIEARKDGVVMLHNLSATEDIMNKGQYKISDGILRLNGKKELSDAMDKLTSPILMSEKEFKKPSNCEYYEDLNRMRLKMMLLPENRRYKANEAINLLYRPQMQKMTVYSDLSDEELKNIERIIANKHLKEAVVADGRVACTEKDKKYIEQYIEESVYSMYEPSDKCATTPFVRYEAVYKHETRGKVNITDFNTMPEKQYIADASNTGFIFEYKKDGLTVYNGYPDENSVFMHIEQNIKVDGDGNYIRDEDFDTAFFSILDNIDTPVALSEAEVISAGTKEALEALVKSRRPDMLEGKARDELIKLINNGNKAEYHELMANDVSAPTKKQQDAMNRIKEFKNNTVLLNPKNSATLNSVRDEVLLTI